MTGRVHPARAVARPVLRRSRARWSIFAGAIVAVTGAAWPEILAAAAAQKAPEAKPAFELHRLVRIAFAGRDGIAKAGDEYVAHRDFGDHTLRRAVAERDIDGGDGGAPVAHP